MKFTTPFFVLTAIFLTSAAAFQRPAGGSDGIYVHTTDKNGTKHSEYVNVIPADDVPTTSTLVTRARVEERGQPGPGTVVCGALTMKPTDVIAAESELADAFGDGGTVNSKSLSSYNYSAVAFACNYGNGQTMDGYTFKSFVDAVSSACGNDTEGYYEIPAWKATYGRTSSTSSFC